LGVELMTHWRPVVVTPTGHELPVATVPVLPRSGMADGFRQQMYLMENEIEIFQNFRDLPGLPLMPAHG